MSLFRGRVRWVLVVWMLVISAVSYLDRVNISIAGPSIEREFHLDHIHLGWVFSAWVLGYALFQAPSGRLADRFGPRKILLLGTVWWAVFTCLTALTPARIAGSLAILVVVRFLLGTGESIVYPATNRLVAAWVPSQERGLANGLIFAGVGLGAAVTPPLIAYITYRYGWRLSLSTCAFIGLVIGALWFVIARDEPEQHPWVTPEEISYISAGLPQTATGRESQSLPWRTILGSKNVWIVTASYFGFGYVAYIFFTWFFTYLNVVRGLNLKASAGYSMLPFAAMAACSSLGGWISDRLTRRHGNRAGRCLSASVAMVAAAIFVGLGTYVSDARLASFVLAGGAGALYLSQSAFWSVSSDIGGRSAGSVSGVMNMGGQLGGAATASATPFVAAHFGWNMSFWVAAGLCFLGALAWLLVDPDKQLTAAKRNA
ncbi:MAG TPA: MFS transporter [Candidatus Limnocylindrales bacterium]|nr:MFS transporter [Candidatus Limnocylindrales bacterium]